MNFIHQSEVRLGRHGMVWELLLVTTDHTFQGCDM